ncbi:hypothetical protein [Heyndrickxia acidiproducens]|uniref:hypothetical protein n=1 Tax=Heyndrickxia acidiproducens TaxID=1121084 RepID=UPI000366A3F5|nr:hypothetical protein [Heyndrickxia acidiproducens]
MNVWYASYGSNLLRERFMCYIAGGRPPGSSQEEPGCTDHTPPMSDKKIMMPYPLYFARENSKWGKGGVAFISTKRHEKAETVGRMYLVTAQQFKEVVDQENGLAELEIDLKKVIEEGSARVGSGWYNRIVYLGMKDGAPIFTFTTGMPMDGQLFVKPPAPYLKTIARGLAQLKMGREEIIRYFLQKSGIRGQMDKTELEQLIYK